MPFQNVYTKLTLEKVNAGGGIDYGRIILKNVGRVPEEYHTALLIYQTKLSSIIGTQPVEVHPDDENETEADGPETTREESPAVA